MKFTIVDYGLSNLLSVKLAFEHFGAETEITATPEGVQNAQALVLPGVGAFRDGMAGLKKLQLLQPLFQKVAENTPLLGICLGMQMLFERSDEFGNYQGLGLIPGKVEKIPALAVDGTPQAVPHIQWDPLYPAGGRTDFSGTALCGITPGQECYFIHSYEAKPTDANDCLAETVYGGRRICAAAQKGRVLGTQFHPEKSGQVGLSIIENYIRLCEQ